MKTVIIADIYPGAEFKQKGSSSTLIVDELNEGVVIFHSFNDETKIPEPTSTEQFETFIYMLNVAGYEKIN